MAHEHDGSFDAINIENIEARDDMRIGSLYGYCNSDAFIGVASSCETGQTLILNIYSEHFL